MKRLTLLAFGLLASLHAQYPPDIQWRKIETAHFEIIFPREISADAQRAANMLETLYGPLTESLATGLKRTSVFLPNQGITRYVGGYVSLFPRMATFNSMPAQGFRGTNDWLNVLAANEGRHLAQIAKMNHGASRIVSVLFGEAGQAFVLGWTLPEWWLAGDARVAETTMLRGGVGQFASSEATTRALLLSGQHYSFMKAMHGSYRDGVPSQDELGAFLVGHVDRTAAADSWKRIMERTANHPLNPLALSMAMKKETGRSAATNYYEAMSELGELWKSKAEPLEYSQPFVLNRAPKLAFTGYYQPVFQPDGSVIAQKTGLDTFPVEMVRIHPDGHEERLFRVAPSVVASNRTSVVNGRMVLDEYVPDIRWRRGYSEIVIRDVATGRTRRLTHHTRFMNPVFSPDGARIAVVEFLPDRRCSLVVLDAATGAELRRLPSPSNDMIYSPAWSEDGRRLAMIVQGARGRALSIADLESGNFQEAIPHSDEDLAHPVFWGAHVLYESSYGGAMNIYAVETSSRRRFRVTSAKFGANYPSISPDRTRLLYSDYTSRGYDIAELPLDPSTWSPIDTVADINIGYYGPYRDYSSEAPATQYPVERYRPSLHLFEFHSWGFTSGPPDLGFGLMSNDKMGLLDFNASVLYNSNEGTAGFQTGVSYNRFFPVLDFSFSDRNRSLEFASGTQNWTERTATAGFHVPLNLSRGYYSTGLSIGAEVQSIRALGGGLVPLTYGIAFSRIRQRSARDLAPVWAQQVRFTYRQSPFANSLTGNFLSAGGRFAVPGFARHHTLQFDGGYERNAGNYFFSSELLFPRGYTAVTGTNLTKASVTYGFPLFYPDWALGQFLYIKRVSANLFYDYGRVDETLYRSTGVEAVFDLNVFHFPTLRAGVRYPYRLEFHNARVRPFLEYRW